MTRVTIRHLRTIPGTHKRRGWCNDRARVWFKRHNLDWTDFVRNGIDADILLATGCGLALAMVAWARECDAKEASDGR